MLPPLFLFSSLYATNIKIAGKLRLEKRVVFGEVYKEKLMILNTSDLDAEVLIKQTDFIFKDGKMVFVEKGTAERSNANWVSLFPSHFILPAKRQASIPILVQVPESGIQGDYYSAFFVEALDRVALKGNVKVKLKYAVPLITFIEGGESKIEFEEIECTKEGILTVNVFNSGETILMSFCWAEINGKKFESEEQRIYPNQGAQFELNLSELPDGLYKALIMIDDGEEEVFVKRVELRLGEEPPPLPTLYEKYEKRAKEKRRRKKQLNFSISARYGSRYTGFRFSNITHLGWFTAQAGVNELWVDDRLVESFSTGISARFKPFTFRVGSMSWNNEWRTMLSAWMNLRRTRIGLSYILSSKFISIHASQRVFRNQSISFRAYFLEKKTEWYVEYRLPFTIKF